MMRVAVRAAAVVSIALSAIASLPSAILAQDPPPVKLAFGATSSLMNSGALRLEVGEEFDLGLAGYRANGDYGTLAGPFHPTFTTSDPKIVVLKQQEAPHIVTVRAVGHGTAVITARAGNLSLDLPVITGDAKALTVAADLPPELQVNRVVIHVAPSQFGGGALRLPVGGEAEVGAEALLAQSGDRATLEIYPPTWVSSNPKAFTVTRSKGSASGATVRGVANGSGTLTLSVQGVKTTIPVLIGTARSQRAAATAASGQPGSGASTTPFNVATPGGPSYVSGAQTNGGSGLSPLTVSAPVVFGIKDYRLERLQPGASGGFGEVANTFRIVGSTIEMTDSTLSPVIGPWFYRVTAVDQAGKSVPGDPTLFVPGGADAGVTAFVGKRTPAGVELTWNGTPPPQIAFQVVRFALDGSGWTRLDVPAATGSAWKYTDTTAPAGTAFRYAVILSNGGIVAGAGPTITVR